jgi:hypothetical protein
MAAINARTRAPGELRWFSPRVIGAFNKVGPIFGLYLMSFPAIFLRAGADDHGLPVRRDFTAVENVLLHAAPNEWLQGLLLDFAPMRALAVLIYFSWHALPLAAGLPILLNRRRYEYWQLVFFLLFTYYAVQPFFYLYPLEPPWMHHDNIPRVHDLFYDRAAGQDNNPHAAMPSLHVAMPMLVALWYGLHDRIGKLFAWYSVLIGVTVVYTGDHYVADLAAGYAFAFVVYGVVRLLGLPLLPERNPAPAEGGG